MVEHTEQIDGPIGATGITGHGRPSRTFGRGRICAEPSCGTHLSIYNDGKFCYLHEPQAAPRLRGKNLRGKKIA